MSDVAPEGSKRSPFTRPGFILSASLVLVLMAAVIVIAFLPNGNNNQGIAEARPTGKATVSASATPTEDGLGDSICGLPGSMDTALGAAPQSDWELIGKTAVPTAPKTAGPGVVNSDGVRSCFANSPVGALYAAANIFGLVTAGNQQAVLEELAGDSAARDQQLADLKDSTAEPVSAQIGGFKIQNYTGSSATVDLGIELDSGAVGSVPVPLIWENGDWKLNVAQGGVTGSQQLIDLSAYIPWSGV